MNPNVLYERSDEIISYVASKIEKFERDKFQQKVKDWINHYCEKYLHVIFHPSIVNEFYDVFYGQLRDIVKANERQRQQEMERWRMSDYEASKTVAKKI